MTEIKDFPLCVSSITEIEDFLSHLYLTYPAMLQTFGSPRRFTSLHPHVWAFAKVTSQLEQARLVVDFGSLLLSYFAACPDKKMLCHSERSEESQTYASR